VNQIQNFLNALKLTIPEFNCAVPVSDLERLLPHTSLIFHNDEFSSYSSFIKNYSQIPTEKLHQ